MGKIHLIRHGLTQPNIKRQYYGVTDVPLSNEGVDLITEFAIKGIYPKENHADFFTTGLIRTEQTFFLIYGCIEHGQIHDLREYNFGEFEMKTHSELKTLPEYQAWINDKEGKTPCPNGESRLEFRARVNRGFERISWKEEIEESQKNKIIVCHGGVISVIMEKCFPERRKNVFEWQPEPGRGFTLISENGKLKYEEI